MPVSTKKPISKDEAISKLKLKFQKNAFQSPKPMQKSKHMPSKEQTSTVALNEEEKEFLDFTKPLFMQMVRKRFIKKFYLDEVHKPRYFKTSLRFFDNPILEILTRTPWYVIPIFWTPVAFFHLHFAYQDWWDSSGPFSKVFSCLLVVIGFFSWSLLEYIFHRGLFHMDHYLPESQFCFAVHFLFHGCHHMMPMDRLRLVMPPLMFVTLSFFPYIVLKYLLIGSKLLNPLYAGVVLAYLCYDMCHYFAHHGYSKIGVLNYLKSYHMAHHYKDYSKGFGVTNVFWDKFSGTYLEIDSKKNKIE